MTKENPAGQAGLPNCGLTSTDPSIASPKPLITPQHESTGRQIRYWRYRMLRSFELGDRVGARFAGHQFMNLLRNHALVCDSLTGIGG